MSFAAVLLAGGESRRMGRDKATLSFRGKPLWQHQLDTLRDLGPDRIFISAREKPCWQPNDVQFVSDDPPSRGPLGGLVATLARTETGHLLALAIDMPFMTAAFLAALSERVAMGCGVIPRLDDRFEPLAAIYPCASHVDLAAALRSNDVSLQSIATRLVDGNKLVVHEIGRTDRHLFRNLNEPADFDRLQT